uniref:Uncharacterized protein n=1 Tax=Mustela putorius furo TaxID=9669 RepID=M3XYM2_MUSPF
EPLPSTPLLATPPPAPLNPPGSLQVPSPPGTRHFQWGPGKTMRVGGWFQPASGRQKNWQRRSAWSPSK